LSAYLAACLKYFFVFLKNLQPVTYSNNKKMGGVYIVGEDERELKMLLIDSVSALNINVVILC